jgi:O-antigen/teichoic acid export membrane protein
LAKFLSPGELGTYGLVAAGVGYSIFLVGLDFYTYTTREIISSSRSHWGHFLKNQAALAGALYIATFPLIVVAFGVGALPWQIFPLFLALMVLEHSGQELDRVLVAISATTAAAVVLFLRSGLWPLVVVVLMAQYSGLRQLDTVLAAWIMGGVVAVSVGMRRVLQSGAAGWGLPVSTSWIRNGLRTALPLLGGTLALRALFAGDRFIVDEMNGPDALASYVLFSSMAAALTALLAAGVHVFYYPKLISAYAVGRTEAFRDALRAMFLQTVLVTLIFVVVSSIMLPLALRSLDVAAYSANADMYPWILAGVALYNLSMVPHYGLYAQHRDKVIVWTHVSALLFGLAALPLFAGPFPRLAVPICVTLAFGFILGSKWVLFRRGWPVSEGTNDEARNTN